MAQLLHNYFQDMAWPYITNVSPTETRPHWIYGSNTMSTVRGQQVRRPGFTAYTTDELTGTVYRIYTWQLWGGTYFVMLSVLDGSTTKVYKLKVGTDTTFQLLAVANSSTTTPYDFDVSGNFLFMGNGTDMWKYDGTTVTKWGIAKPAAAPTATPAAGALSPTSGFRWKYAFGTTVHVGDISDSSVSSGAQSSKKFAITGSTTADTQVTRVYIFRTTDGGGTWFKVTDVAYSVGWSYDDTTTDVLLSNVQAPEAAQNVPPVASRGVTFFANRLWTHAGDTVYFSNFEEQLLGREEESFDSLNKFRFGAEVIGLAVVQKALLVLTASSIYRIIGDTRNTFARAPFLSRFGIRNMRNKTQAAKVVAWFDTSSTVWYTDAASLKELSLPIRPDFESFGQATSSITFHNAGKIKWLVLQDSALNKMYTFDQDLGQWNVPWSIGGTAIHSGEVSAGDVRLFTALKGSTKSKILYMTPATYTDVTVSVDTFTPSATYAAELKTGNINIVPSSDNGPRDGLTGWGDMQMVGLERNSVLLSKVALLTDDDPSDTALTYTDITPNRTDPSLRTQGTTLKEDWFFARKPSAKRVSIDLQWVAASTEFKLHTLDVAYELGNTSGEF